MIRVVKKWILLTSIFICILLYADGSLVLRRRAGYPMVKGGAGVALQVDDTINIIEREGYTLGYAPKFRQCVWAMYRLHPKDFEDPVGRIGIFTCDNECSQSFAPGVYVGSGFDRGHMAPSGDMQFSLRAQKESFLMGNIVPQVPRVNRGEWKRLESEVRGMVAPQLEQYLQRYRPVYVITGPIFSIEKSAVTQPISKQELSPIPVAFYKVCRWNGRYKAFLIENKSDARMKKVDIGEIELKTGLTFCTE